jgi:hypothetical protein
MSDRHQACHDVIQLTEAILELLHDESVIAAVASIGLGPTHSLLVLACEQLEGRAKTVHNQVMGDEQRAKGGLH